MKIQRNCRFCNEKFTPAHGNRWYCCDEHQKYQKYTNQNKAYSILKEFRKGYLKNFNLIEQLLSKKAGVELPLLDLQSNGFNPECFYGRFRDNSKNIWCKIGGYSFNIFNQSNIAYIKLKK